MPFDSTLAERVRRALARRRGFAEKKMFGGMGFLLHGNMCVGVLRSDLILRLGPEQTQHALTELGVRPFDLTGRVMKGWVMVGPDGYASDDDLRRWVQQASKFVSTLEPKATE